jgi:transposase
MEASRRKIGRHYQPQQRHLAPSDFGDQIIFLGRTSPGVALLSWECPGLFLGTKLVREFDFAAPETPFALPDERSQVIAKFFGDFSNAIFFFGE